MVRGKGCACVVEGLSDPAVTDAYEGLCATAHMNAGCDSGQSAGHEALMYIWTASRRLVLELR